MIFSIKYWHYRVLWILVLWLLPSCDNPMEVDIGPASKVSKERLARMNRGVNLSHWFAQTSITTERMRTFMTEEDFQTISALGFRHVRFPVDPMLLLNEQQPENLVESNWREVRRALEMMMEKGLAVTLEMHGSTTFKKRLETEPTFRTVFTQLWHALAIKVSDTNPEFLFLEPLNEPVMNDSRGWQVFQNQLLLAIRSGAPKHTLVAVGDMFSSLDQLNLLQPVDDPNVVYAFHFYEPGTFTHQGATWAVEAWPYLREIPYPFDAKRMNQLLPQLPVIAQPLARAYAAEKWDRSQLQARLAKPFLWGQRFRVPVICAEFGVYRLVALPQDRLNWIRDVRIILERYQIPWTMWDYSEGFGVAIRENGKREVDMETVRALGLHLY
ncbi:MAG TPA: cellulase family glycosylhydrolase [Rhodothermales bacterium]|nr:cellulase family glycosylhydrolase [Rhodothermales bacterium]HRR09405.1 cellulase family glycosylhydrolase [Rhodothermales bacterium]